MHRRWGDSSGSIVRYDTEWNHKSPISTVIFKLQRLTVHSIKSVDDIHQQFQAHVYFEFVIPDGQTRPELIKGNGDSDCPPFRSAQWYWQLQLELSNACRYEIKERKVVMSKTSDDILCCLRIDGVFFSSFNMYDFPLDAQDVRFHLEFLCSQTGPCPIDIYLPDDPLMCSIVSNGEDSTLVESSEFVAEREDIGDAEYPLGRTRTWESTRSLGNTQNRETSSVTLSWDIIPQVMYKVTTNVFEDGGIRKVYPGLMCSIKILRADSRFYLSLLAPMSCLSGFSIMTFFFPDMTLRVTMGVSLISASVPQFVRVQMFMPKVFYATRLHTFMMANGVLMIWVVVINSAILAFADSTGVFVQGEDLRISYIISYVPTLLSALFWLALHVYAAWTVNGLRRARRPLKGV